MATLRELKGRIGSVGSSEKITGAMKMISSAKMHKAEGILRRLSPFRDCVQGIIGNLLSSDAAVSSPLTVARQAVHHATVVMLGSDDGLCGAYNVNIFKGVIATIAQLRQECGEDVEIKLVPVGKKLQKAVEKLAASDPKLHYTAAAGVDSKSDGDAVKLFAQGLEQEFLSGATDRVDLTYVHFYSAGRQRLVNDSYQPGATQRRGQGKRTPVSIRARCRHNLPHRPADVSAVANAGGFRPEQGKRAGSACDGNAERQRQCPETSRATSA